MSLSSGEKLPSPQQRLFPRKVPTPLPSPIKEPRAHFGTFAEVVLHAPRFAGDSRVVPMLPSPSGFPLVTSKHQACDVTSLAAGVSLSRRERTPLNFQLPSRHPSA